MQAVILAGGKGTRFGEVTKKIDLKIHAISEVAKSKIESSMKMVLDEFANYAKNQSQ